MFDLLNFQPHSIVNAVQALYKFDNDWQISVVSGSDGKLYGKIDDGINPLIIILFANIGISKFLRLCPHR